MTLAVAFTPGTRLRYSGSSNSESTDDRNPSGPWHWRRVGTGRYRDLRRGHSPRFGHRSGLASSCIPEGHSIRGFDLIRCGGLLWGSPAANRISREMIFANAAQCPGTCGTRWRNKDTRLLPNLPGQACGYCRRNWRKKARPGVCQREEESGRGSPRWLLRPHWIVVAALSETDSVLCRKTESWDALRMTRRKRSGPR